MLLLTTIKGRLLVDICSTAVKILYSSEGMYDPMPDPKIVVNVEPTLGFIKNLLSEFPNDKKIYADIGI